MPMRCKQYRVTEAIGDIIHGPMLAHKAEDEGAMVAEPLGTRSLVDHES